MKEGTEVTLSEVKHFERPTMVDYLRAGWQVSLVNAVDYTASNGNPKRRDSLHYLGGNNQYELAIKSIGQIIEPYDSDRMFPTFGFGGVPLHMGGLQETSHCFPMNGNP